MKYIHLKKFIPSVILTSFLFITGCQEKWNEHYDQDSFDLPDNSLKETISNDPQLSTFYQLLKKTGYDEIIDLSQSFTVWAPVNEALSAIDTSDYDIALEIVENHITRGRISTSNVATLPVRMLNGKFNVFSTDGSSYAFGNQELTSPNTNTANGLLHILNGYAPYLNNLWEYIGDTDNLDSLRNFIYGESKYIFDPLSSTEIGYDTLENIIYDSVFIYSNEVLQSYGAIDNENNKYTLILPDNSAWNEAYNRIESYFNFPDDAGGSGRKRYYTTLVLVKDMFFSGQIEDPQAVDSMISTSGTMFYNPAQLYTNVYETEYLSNGIANKTNLMPFSDTSSWFKEIRVEAEYQNGRENKNNIIYPKTSFGSGLDVSNEAYIHVDPTAPGSSVEFSIPNTLSAKYNIYCQFVPASIIDITDITPTKVKFVLTYITSATGSVFVKEIVPDFNTTFPVGITKMLVTDFDFIYANIPYSENDKISVKLDVINDVSSAEEQAGEYSRTMRIDCIILEPVLD